jgi:pyruvate/2-oxoglutarate/acetoin dehydrogenase E1 component
MAGRHVTLLRYAGCILNDAEVDAARQGGVQLEVVDLQSNTSTDRNGK